MKAHVTNIWLEEPGMKGFGAIRLDFSNDYHCRVEIAGSGPENLSIALQKAALMVKRCDHGGVLEVQS